MLDITSVKIVTDSSADLLSLSDIPFAGVPLKIITSEKEYVDDAALDVDAMIADLATYQGKSSTACPSPAEWLSAFGDAQYVFCVSITSGLSGCCNAARIAKEDYENQYPDRRVFVLDSLSTGPEMQLLAGKIQTLILEGHSFDEICKRVTAYHQRTGLLFMLESMHNLANNGRVSHFVAKAAGFLGIRLVGTASDHGQLQPLDKCRGEKKALTTIIDHLKARGVRGGTFKIAHCDNEPAANALKALIIQEFKNAVIQTYRCRGLCSFYAEKGGLLIGFETQ